MSQSFEPPPSEQASAAPLLDPSPGSHAPPISPSSSRPPAAETAPPPSTGWRRTFITALNNVDHQVDRGFVALVTTPGVEAVQAVCAEQTYNPFVLTARYRIAGTPVVGTLLSAFANDLLAMSQSRTGHLGDLRTVRPDGWAELLSRISPDGLDWVRPVAESQQLDWNTLRVFFERLGSALRTGERLVLLASGHEGTQVEAEIADLYGLRGFLPYRVSVVIGAPANRTRVEQDGIPTNDFLVLDGVPEDRASTEEQPRQGREANFSADLAAKVDLLGRAQLANTLANLLLNKDTGEMCVGVEAPWGKGKSSFLNLVEEYLENIAGKKNAVVVRFDAWQYDSAEQAWAGLAKAVIACIETSLGWLGKWRLRWHYAWRFRRRRLLAGGSAGLVALVIGIGLFLVGNGEELSGVDLKEPAARVLAGVTGISVTALVLIGSVLRLTKPVAERISEYFARPNFGERLGFQHEVIRDLNFCRQWLVKRRPMCRVIVMVDDLDRCSDEKTVELLQAINLVLAGSGLYVLLGLDGDVVRRAVYRHYAGKEEELAEKFKLPDAFAEDYLRKIVQFSVHLPGSSREERLRYLDALLQPVPVAGPGAAAPGGQQGDLEARLAQIMQPTIVKETLVKDTADDVVALKAYQHMLEDNPRELKRMVNVHRFVKIALLRDNEQQPPRTQRLLVQWLVFCTCHAELVPDVLRRVDQALPAAPETDVIADALPPVPGSPDWATSLREGLPQDIITAADLAPGTALRQAAQLAVNLP
jgi:hypothetical protein